MASALSQATTTGGLVAFSAASPVSQRRNATFTLALAPGLGSRSRLTAKVGRLCAKKPCDEGRLVGIQAMAAAVSQDGAFSSDREESRVALAAVGVVEAVRRVAEVVKDFLLATYLPSPRSAEEAALGGSLKGCLMLAAGPLFFASINQSVSTPLTVVASGMAKWLELYSGVLMVRVLLSWFPNIPWERQPLQAMRDMCDPYLNLFRNIVPPVFNALDLSPMLAFLVLGTLTSILNTTVQG